MISPLGSTILLIPCSFLLKLSPSSAPCLFFEGFGRDREVLTFYA